MTGEPLFVGNAGLKSKYAKAAATQNTHSQHDVKVFKRIFVETAGGGYGKVSFAIDLKHYVGEDCQKYLSHTGR